MNPTLRSGCGLLSIHPLGFGAFAVLDSVDRGLEELPLASAALAGRYVRGRNTASMTTMRGLDRRLSDLGEVEALSILPVVERLTRGPEFRGEPGLSYLIRADDLTLLFDCGLGTSADESVLDANARTLGSRAGVDHLVGFRFVGFDRCVSLPAWPGSRRC